LYSIERRERVRAVGSRHTANSQICSDGNVIAIQNLNRIVGLGEFHGEETVVVEAGVRLGELVDWLHDRGKALGFAFPNYRGVTMAGAVSTGAHGSSCYQDSVISSLIREVVIITGDGSIRTYSERETPMDLWKALKVGLGALGMIVQLRLKIVEQFNVEMMVSYMDEGDIIAPDGLVRWQEECDYDQYVWFPTLGQIVRVYGQVSKEPVKSDVRNTLLVSNLSRASFDFYGWLLHYGRWSRWINGRLERTRYARFRKTPPLEVRAGAGRRQPVTRAVGPSHRLLISESDAPERYFPATDWELALPMEKAGGAMRFVKECVDAHGLALPCSGSSYAS
jgi:FAD/FMN-containing dehydrogenase